MSHTNHHQPWTIDATLAAVAVAALWLTVEAIRCLLKG